MVIHAKSGYGVDPYFNIPIPKMDEGVAEEVVLPKE
jgi:hypothetical protein